MKIGAILQARMSSRRFPGKVLHQVAGKPMLQYLLERLEHSAGLDAVVVATSIDDSDEAIEAFCRRRGVPCHRGSLLNVAGRFKEVLESFGFDAFVRVNGDAPLLDQRLIDHGIDIFNTSSLDIVTNVLRRTYPTGQSVEVLRSETFLAAYQAMRDDADLEHVTTFFYKNAENFRIHNFVSETDYHGVHLSMDTEDDMKRFAVIVDRMERPQWTYGLKEVFQLYREVGADGEGR